jgi:hypothetical protein
VTWSKLGNPKVASLENCEIGNLSGPLFANPARGWLTLNLGAGGAAATGGILSTEDGGRTWRCSETPANTRLVSAADPLDVWVTSEDRATQASTLYASEDGGQTWRPLKI